MRRLWIAQMLVLAWLCEAAQSGDPLPASADPEPIATRQTGFSIPFQVHKAQQPAQEPVEVRLFVSTDRGTSWRPYARVAPSDGQFIFRAAGDGEYWFLVRTLDKSGQLRPQGPNRPELRVVVDTTPPKLDIEATQGPAGQVTARWTITDLDCKPESLRLNYRTAPDAQWLPITVDQNKWKADGNSRTGEVTWLPPGDVAKIEIRAEVADSAGNPAVSHAQVAPERSVAAAKPPTTSVATDQGWRSARIEGAQPAGPSGTMAALTTETRAPAAGAAQTAERPAPRYPETSPGPRYPYSTPGPSANGIPGTSPSPAATGAVGLPPSEPVAGTVSPAVRQQYVAQSAADDPWATSGMPPGPRPRMVNSRVFELEYELGSTSLSQGSVELWGTRDAGRTWTSFGQDRDGRSPMIVTAPDEGIYGFRVVVSSDPRTPAPGPRGGELPDVWIGIDLTRPTARILSAEQGQGAEAGQLVLRWEAADRLLAARPVSLFYSETGAGGTWSTIATGLENTGQHTWTVPPQVGERIYIRLEVRDESGNLTVTQTPEAVVIRPRTGGARIRDVRPVSPSARGPRHYNFG